ncbi:PAS domain S-box protein [Candidatus Bipolaricaulota bacterium]|nr:PAS domain S-box protein [Candidatus Bipolaricaulota bacterium]
MSFSAYETKELIKYLPEALFLEDFDGNILDVNTEACKLLGYDREELLERDVEKIVPDGQPVFLPDQIDEATRSGKPIETVNLHKDGTEIPVELRGRILEVGGRKRMLVSVRDITERKEAEEKYKIVARGSSQPIYLFQDGDFKYVNESFENLTGYSREELKDTDLRELIHPDFRKEIAKWTKKALTGDDSGLPERVEYQILTKEGEAVWVRSLPSLVEYQGSPAIAGNAVDITEEKEIERKLRAERELFESIMTLSLDLVYFKDDQHRFERANEEYTSLLAMEETDMIGKTARDFWPKEAEEIMEDERRALNGEPVIGRERVVTLPTGEKRWYSINKLPRRDADGNIIGFLGMDRDITKRKKLEQSLQEERSKLRNLHEAVDLLQQQESEKDLAQSAVEAAEEMLDFEICAIDLREEDYLVPKAISGGLDREETTAFQVGEGIGGKTVQEGETIWGKDVRDHPEAKPTKEEWRAFISVPIGEVGTLQVISKEVGSFDRSDVELAEILADHLNEEIQRIRLEEQLRKQAIRDPLTDLYNRRYFNETLGKEVEKCKRYGSSLAFLMTDVNRFKEINDRYTHQTGDEVLQEVATLLKDNVRDADTVVRYGGDEFLIMLPETKKVDSTVSRIEEELRIWNEQSDLIDFTLTLAMGSSQWNPDQDGDVEEALKEADVKMYKDKRNSSNFD